MKLNNRGFSLSVIIYPVLILIITLALVILLTLVNGSFSLNKTLETIQNRIDSTDAGVIKSIPDLTDVQNLGADFVSFMADVTKIEFVNSLNNSNMSGAIDFSEAEDNSVRAWIIGNTLYIGADGKLYMPEDSSAFFSNLNKLTDNGIQNIVNLNYVDTSHVVDMRALFSYCENLTSLDLSNFNTSNVTDMQNMFGNCSSLTSLDVSNFNTLKVTNMQWMFDYCSGLITLDVSGLETSNVTNMYGMFSNCSSLTSLDLSGFETSKVIDMSLMFNRCEELTNLDVSNFNTSKVTNMASMFSGCSKATDIIFGENFITSKVTDMRSMFQRCLELTNLNLSKFDTSKVTNMVYMFLSCNKLSKITVGTGWNTNSVSNSMGMFNGCTSLVGGSGTVFNSSMTDKTYAKIDGGTSNPGYLWSA